VRQAFEWVGAHQDLKQDLYHPDFEFDATGVAPDTGGPLGLAESLEFLRAYWATFDDFEPRIEAVILADETRVVVHVCDVGRVKGTDSEMRTYRFEVLTLQDGKIVRLSVHDNRQKALDAMGPPGVGDVEIVRRVYAELAR
jgi:ketosteroid isomerase-like protein